MVSSRLRLTIKGNSMATRHSQNLTKSKSSLKKKAIRFTLISLATVTLVVLGFIGYVFNYLKLPAWGAHPKAHEIHADPHRLHQHVLYLTQDVFPRDAKHPENLNQAAQYIQGLFSQHSPRVREQVYSADGIEYRNVIAGFGPDSEPMMVVGAHYDAYKEYPGADDNASGVAVLLEIARLLGQSTVPRQIELVAYSTEEPPYYGTDNMGSAVHAVELRERNVELLGMICLEMVGYYTDTQNYPDDILAWLYPQHGQFIGIIGRWEDRHLVRFLKKGIKRTALPVESCTMPMENSDHLHYWRQGYHAIMVTDTAMVRNSNYHTENDTADTLNYTKMAYVADGIVCALLNLDRL